MIRGMHGDDARPLMRRAGRDGSLKQRPKIAFQVFFFKELCALAQMNHPRNFCLPL